MIAHRQTTELCAPFLMVRVLSVSAGIDSSAIIVPSPQPPEPSVTETFLRSATAPAVSAGFDRPMVCCAPAPLPIVAASVIRYVIGVLRLGIAIVAIVAPFATPPPVSTFVTRRLRTGAQPPFARAYSP